VTINEIDGLANLRIDELGGGTQSFNPFVNSSIRQFVNS